MITFRVLERMKNYPKGRDHGAETRDLLGFTCRTGSFVFWFFDLFYFVVLFW